MYYNAFTIAEICCGLKKFLSCVCCTDLKCAFVITTTVPHIFMMSVIASICHTKYGHQSTFDETHRTVFVGFIVHQYNYVTMLSVFTVIFLRVS